MHLRQNGFSYSVCGPFTKNKQTNKQTNKQKTTEAPARYVYQNKIDKACFTQEKSFR